MRLQPCYDGRRHRWQRRHRVTMARLPAIKTPHPHDLWCERCGKWKNEVEIRERALSQEQRVIVHHGDPDSYARAYNEGYADALSRDLMERIVRNGVPPDALMDSTPAGQNLRDWWLNRWAPVLQEVRRRLARQSEDQ